MPSRQRVKISTLGRDNGWELFSPDDPHWILKGLQGAQPFEYMDDFYNGPLGVPNPVYHKWINQPYSDTLRGTDGFYRVYQDQQSLNDFPVAIRTAIKDRLGLVDITTMPSQANNQFELFNFITDIDGKIGKWIKSMFRPNYGNYRWGLLPFISDVISFIDSYRDLKGRIAKEFSEPSSFEGKREFQFLPDRSSPLADYSATGYFLLSGTRQPLNAPDEPLEALLVILDELGVHPDLRTIWDAIPLSFVVDYFIPIGEALEACHPRGWFTPSVIFDGWVTCRATSYRSMHRYGLEQKHAKYFSRSLPLTGYRCESYERYFVRDLVSHKAKIGTVEYKFPNPLELFNSFYLGITSRGVRSKAFKKPVRKQFLPFI